VPPPRPVPRAATTPAPARRARGRSPDLWLLLALAGFVTLRLVLGGGAGEWVVIGLVACALFLRPRG